MLKLPDFLNLILRLCLIIVGWKRHAAGCFGGETFGR
jgi:uncharacterized membrane protein